MDGRGVLPQRWGHSAALPTLLPCPKNVRHGHPHENHQNPLSRSARSRHAINLFAPGVLGCRLPLPMALDHVNIYRPGDGAAGWIRIDTGFDTPSPAPIGPDLAGGVPACRQTCHPPER